MIIWRNKKLWFHLPIEIFIQECSWTRFLQENLKWMLSDTVSQGWPFKWNIDEFVLWLKVKVLQKRLVLFCSLTRLCSLLCLCRFIYFTTKPYFPRPFNTCFLLFPNPNDGFLCLRQPSLITILLALKYINCVLLWRAISITYLFYQEFYIHGYKLLNGKTPRINFILY